MKEISAVELRQSLGRIARSLEKTGEPLLLKVGRRPVGVIVTLQDFRERFALLEAEAERSKLVQEILDETRPGAEPIERVLADIRRR